MNLSVRWLRVTVVMVFGGLLLVFANVAQAQSRNRVIGSQLTATADPLVPRLHGTPCIVPLFSNFQFAHFADTTQSFPFAPPADCPGPWKEVVFTADFSENAGVQFDRTVSLYLGNANLYFGTTPEPVGSKTNTWHVEREVTDYSALLMAAQQGNIVLQNCTTDCPPPFNTALNGVFTVNATLEFYPARRDRDDGVRRVADQVLPLTQLNGGGGVNLPGFLFNPTDQLATTFTLPSNVEQVFFDVITQGQQADEFWYSCLPNDTNFALLSFSGCGNTAFREAQITVDGQLAGIAPVYPWIFAGGLADPNLWVPTPGVQTLDFTPYRVDLTPFAGVLSNGQPHTVAMSIFNAFGQFSVTASLLVFQDHGASTVTGAVIENTLASPAPVVVENLTTTNGNTSGTVSVTSDQHFTIAGFVHTSHGRVETTIEQNLSFLNAQNVVGDNNPSPPALFLEVNGIDQQTEVSSKTTTREDFLAFEAERKLSYPLSMNITITVNPDGSTSVVQTSPTKQGFERQETMKLFDFPIFSSKLNNDFQTIDAITFLANGGQTNTGQKSSQHYKFFDTRGQNYECKIAAENSVLASVDEECDETIRSAP